MRVALVGAELEENLGVRYMASALEAAAHEVHIVPFNSAADIADATRSTVDFDPRIVGLSMVFTNRGREFCDLAANLRGEGYRGYLIAGGPFASFNAERLLQDYPAFDAVGLGEGEDLMCAVAAGVDDVSHIPGLCYRTAAGGVVTNPGSGFAADLDRLAFPKRTTFYRYFGTTIASVLSSRGCWRNCAFCSINAWYERTGAGGDKFRVRSVDNLVREMKDLYFTHGIRVFNFQDDNFFLPRPSQSLRRFEALRGSLEKEGVKGIAIAVKARPDSIDRGNIEVLDGLGIFRVFLGVENASERGLQNLNRKCTRDDVLKALTVLNDFDLHVAFNLLMFEPETTLEDILINLEFMEAHVENPLNFCRAEVHAGTPLEEKLRRENALLGDYFGYDYRIKDPRANAFHQISNLAFFDRNFDDAGLHYFNMQVDFFYQLLRRFYPGVLTQSLRAAVKNFVKRTNLDTYEGLCQIYDFVASVDPKDRTTIYGFANDVRRRIDERSLRLKKDGEAILKWMEIAYERRLAPCADAAAPVLLENAGRHIEPARGGESDAVRLGIPDPLGVITEPIPYTVFKKQLTAISDEPEVGV